MSGLSHVYTLGFNSSTCGYCGSMGYASNKFGLIAVSLNSKDYQSLIDRGWRRSGEYVYKPHMKESCCPQYTIRLNASEFHASKSQRKLINRFNRYIEGTYDPTNKNGEDEEDSETPKKKKSKMAFNLTGSIHESEDRQDWKHRLRIVTEQASFSEEKFKLYQKYQINVHNDEPYEVTQRGFRRFLVDSPLKFEPIDKPNITGYGSFHQCYYLDDKLIAVAVLDILPKCISSVYFMYDPDYTFLQIGKYSALREIAMTQEFRDSGLQDLHWYYMGYYIHTCQKMKYKGQYKPSYLLDPETYEWFPFQQFATLLDKYKYVSLANPPKENAETENGNNEKDPPPGMLDPETVTDNDIKTVIVNYSGVIGRYDTHSNLQSNERLRSEMKMYYAAVGKELAETMVYDGSR